MANHAQTMQPDTAPGTAPREPGTAPRELTAAELQQAGGGYYRVKLANVLVTSYQSGGSSGDVLPHTASGGAHAIMADGSVRSIR